MSMTLFASYNMIAGSPTAGPLLELLVYLHRTFDGEFYQSQDRLMQAMGWRSKWRIEKCLKQLVERGLIAIKCKKVGNSRPVQHISLVNPDLFEDPIQTAQEMIDHPDHRGDVTPTTGVNFTPTTGATLPRSPGNLNEYRTSRRETSQQTRRDFVAQEKETEMGSIRDLPLNDDGQLLLKKRKLTPTDRERIWQICWARTQAATAVSLNTREKKLLMTLHHHHTESGLDSTFGEYLLTLFEEYPRLRKLVDKTYGYTPSGETPSLFYFVGQREKLTNLLRDTAVEVEEYEGEDDSEMFSG